MLYNVVFDDVHLLPHSTEVRGEAKSEFCFKEERRINQRKTLFRHKDTYSRCQSETYRVLTLIHLVESSFVGHLEKEERRKCLR